MDVIRRNTDYALRLVVGLVEAYGSGPVSARELSEKNDVFYDLGCKVLQKLSAAKLVTSQMGPGGGFALAKSPEKINFYEVIKAIQGDICLNRCVPDPKSCPRQSTCVASKELGKLQKYMVEHLSGITLDKLLYCDECHCDNKPKKSRKS